MNIIPPSPSEPIIEEGLTMIQRFRAWTQDVSRLSILEGEGSPEGSVVALPARQYMDTVGAPGAILYIKQTGTGNTGWELIG